MRPVAVVGNNIQTVCTCFLSFVNFVGMIYKGLPPESSCKRFFIAPTTTTVPLTILSTHDCGGEGGKRFSLTQGERLHEGSAPSDKRPCRLIVNRGNYGIVGSINKAADSIKGIAPMLTTPQG